MNCPAEDLAWSEDADGPIPSAIVGIRAVDHGLAFGNVIPPMLAVLDYIDL